MRKAQWQRLDTSQNVADLSETPTMYLKQFAQLDFTEAERNVW